MNDSVVADWKSSTDTPALHDCGEERGPIDLVPRPKHPRKIRCKERRHATCIARRPAMSEPVLCFAYVGLSIGVRGQTPGAESYTKTEDDSYPSIRWHHGVILAKF
jgi:hypothetical protein